MKIDRVFSTVVDEPIVRSRLSGYLAGKGYEKKGIGSDLVFERGSVLGSWLSNSPMKFKTYLTVKSQAKPDGSTQVNVIYDINTSGQIITKREVRVFENEISEIITSVEGFNADISVNAKVEQQMFVEKRRREGSNWFYWIAGLSLVNSAVVLFGGSWNFLIGLGMTQFVDGVALVIIDELGTDTTLVVSGIAFIIDLVIAGMFVLFGIFSRKHKWGYIAGMIVYALDGLIFLIVPDYVSIGFHLFALFGIFAGYQAFRQQEKQQLQPVVLQ